MPSTISGVVYPDTNGDGVQSYGEYGLANVQVTLHDAQGQLIATTTTDGTGYYEFTHDPRIDAAPKTIVHETTFGGLTDNVQTGGVDQFDASLGTLQSVEVIFDAGIETQMKAEHLDPSAATVEQKVEGDLTLKVANAGSLQVALKVAQQKQFSAYDGTMDFAGSSGIDSGKRTADDSKSMKLEAGRDDLSGFIGTGQVNLTSTANADASATGSGNLLTMVQTSSHGKVKVIYTYAPATALRPGDYIIREKTPDGYQDGFESQAVVGKIPNTVGTDELRVTLTSTQNSAQNNFGEVQQAALNGFVYHDPNDNGLREAGEDGISGVTLQLTGTDFAGRPVSLTTTSGADGSYHFQNLLPGLYQILKATQPPGYLNGRDTPGSFGGTASEDLISAISLPSAANGQEYNFGHYKPASISGFVYSDLNNNGLREGGEIGLAGSVIALTGTTSTGVPVYQTTTTAGDGSYRFDNLLPGVYSVTQLTQPAGYLDGIDTAGSHGGTASNELISNVSLPAGAQAVEYNFGEVLPVTPPPPPPPPPPPIITPEPPLPPPPPIIGPPPGFSKWYLIR